MLKDKMKNIKFIYGLIMSCLLVAVGICLITSCVGIYRMGGSPFSRESVAEAFSKICIPVYIALGWLVIGIVMMIIFPDEKSKPKAQKQLDVTYAKLKEKIDYSIDDARVSQLKSGEKARKIIKLATVLLAFVCVIVSCVITFVIVLNSDIQVANKTVTQCALLSLPCLAVALGGGIASKYILNASYKKSIEVAKSIIADKSVAKLSKKENRGDENSNIRLFITLGIIAIGIALLVVGIFGDGIKGTFEKAVRICTECIGLG